MKPIGPFGGVVLAMLALAGCDRAAPGGAGSSPDTTVASSHQGGSEQATSGAPGLSGSPPTATPSGAAAADLNALPPTAAGSASAATQDAGGTTQTLNASDRKFVAEAAAGGLFEVRASQLAADKATDPKVKQFAQMLVADHGNANDELKALAAAHHVTLPSAPPKELQTELDKLKKARGADFDKQYVQRVGLKDHRHDIAAFERASSQAKAPQLKAWVDKTLPTLKEHLAAALKLAGTGTASK